MVTRPDHLVGTDIAVYGGDDGLVGLDDHGEFNLDAGATEQQDGRCGAVLKYTQQRYGETRYCTALPVGTFGDKETNYEYDEYCRNHQSHHALMERAIELTEHGYFGQNYLVFEQSLDTHEFMFAVEMFAGLLDRSQYDFDVEIVTKALDTSDTDLIDEDEVAVDLPLPQATAYQMQANELWYVALDEIVEKRMQDIRLTQGVSTSHVVETAEAEGVITDRIEEGAEHHLNLPISRLTKDKKERLKIGGVEVGAEDDGGVVTFQQNDYTLDVRPTDEVEGEVEAHDAMEIEVGEP